MSNQTKGLAALLAAHGRNGDTELVHVNKRELAALEQLGNRNGIRTTTNPHTGLKEAFNWGSTLGAIGGGIAGTFAAPFTAGVINPYTGAALGSAAGTKLSGGSNEEALMNGVISGVTAWGIGGATDALAEAGKEAGKTAVEEGVKTGVQEGAQATLPQATGTFAGSTQPFGATGNAFVGQGAAPNAFVANAPVTPPPVAEGGLPQLMPDTGYYGAENIGSQGVNTYTSQGTKEMVAAGANPNVTSSVAPGANTLSQSGTNADYWSNVGKGIKSLDTPGKAGEFAVANKGSLMAAGLGGYGMATDAGADQDTATTGGATDDTMHYRGEVYYTPYGERRTRAVPMARGGEVYGDYEGVDEAPDGGYRPGGGLNYAGGGGIGFIDSMQPGGKWGDVTTDAYMAVDKNNPQWLKNIQPGGFIGATQPGYLGAQRRKEDEERAKQEEAAGIAAAAKAKDDAAFQQKWTDRYSQGFAEGGYTGPRDGDAIRVIMQALQQEQDEANQLESYRALWPLVAISGRQNEAADMRRALDAEDEKRSPFNSPAIRHIAGLPQEKQQMAMGGIANLGHYSDGGSLLRGPGDGVSDSIPASIEGKREARLADGEFVIPARAVSELGNGSTEAGSKQLYAMLDRIAAKRKKGKGLAYQANPKKMMPA